MLSKPLDTKEPLRGVDVIAVFVEQDQAAKEPGPDSPAGA